MAADLFSPDYFAAKDRFRAAAEKVRGRLDVLPLDCKGPGGEALTIDIAWFGAASPRRVLLHSSGLHGVEGFAGSAIQLQLLETLPLIAEDAALVVVHALNPHGMSWLRRVNENNVDLNRNCLEGEKYEGAPAAYSKLNPFLNPESPPAPDLFLAKAALLILRYGMASLKQSVVGGQYEFPRGLFFGGKRLEQGVQKYREYLGMHLASVETLVVVDVHTGIGKYAEDSLLVETKDYARLRPVFGPRITALESDQGPAYKVRGGLASIFTVLPNASLTFIGQEFGTYSPIKVLHALREENRWHHYGGGGLEHPVKQTLEKTFCPDDDAWRQRVLQRGRDLLKQAMDYGMLCATGGKNAISI